MSVGRCTGKSPPPFTTSATINKPFLEVFHKLCKKLRDQWGGTMMSRIQDIVRLRNLLQLGGFFSVRFCEI